jgi:WhiB family redox-sensing transcriptional regulator
MSFLDVGWQESALCRQVDPDLFHPTPGGPQIRPARKICARCSVRLDCINYAIGRGFRQGIWGGYSGKQLSGLVKLGLVLDELPDYTDRRRADGPRGMLET